MIGVTARLFINRPSETRQHELQTQVAPDSKAEPHDNVRNSQPIEEKQLSLFCWAEYIPQGVIDDFAKETGIKVAVENYASNEELIGKLLAGGGKYDLIQPSEYALDRLIKANLLLKLNHDLLPNLKNLAPEFQRLSFDPGNHFSVPYLAGFVGICFNKEKIKNPINNFRDVFVQEHAKRIVIINDAREIVSWALADIGLDVNDINENTLRKVTPILEKWIPLVSIFDSDSPKTALFNGQADIGIIWSGEAAILINADKRFDFVLPENGAHFFIDSIAIPKNASHPTNAHLFINYLLRPDVGKRISDIFPYYNPNLASRMLLGQEQLSNQAAYPPASAVLKMQVFRDIGEQAVAVDRLVSKFLNTYSRSN